MNVCANKEKKQGQYVACSVQGNMFSHETYGCTSWSSYIVAVISGFILSSLPFVSQFYWIAPSLPLHPMFISAISLYCCLEISLVLSLVHTRASTQRRLLTKFKTGGTQSSFKSYSYPKTSLFFMKVTTVSKMHFSQFQMLTFKSLKHPWWSTCVCVCVFSV